LLPRLNDAGGEPLAQALANEPSSDDPEFMKALDTIRLCVDFCSSHPQIDLLRRQIDSLRSKRIDPGAELDIETASRIDACYTDCFRDNPQAETIIDDVHQYWRRYIDRAFPLIWIDKENGVAIFSLMFNAVSGRATLGTNAIGHLDRAQAERLIQWLRDLDSVIKTVIVMEHYPIARGPNEIMPVPPWPKTLSPTKWWNDVKDSKMYAYAFLVNNQGAGAEVLRTMRDMAEAHRDRSYFLLFGHRHQKKIKQDFCVELKCGRRTQ
jgi:hypothetical protein